MSPHSFSTRDRAEQKPQMSHDHAHPQVSQAHEPDSPFRVKVELHGPEWSESRLSP